MPAIKRLGFGALGGPSALNYTLCFRGWQGVFEKLTRMDRILWLLRKVLSLAAEP